jgi:hypothetical protein
MKLLWMGDGMGWVIILSSLVPPTHFPIVQYKQTLYLKNLYRLKVNTSLHRDFVDFFAVCLSTLVDDIRSHSLLPAVQLRPFKNFL